MAVLALAGALAWREQGSIAGKDWLNYAVPITLLLAVAALAGGALRPRRAPAAAIVALVALAAWTAASLSWAPLPTLGRDEALLPLLYAVVLAVPALTLRTAADRLAAVTVVALALGALAAAVGVDLLLSANPLPDFRGGRLYAPLTYVNAQAALFLVGFWPAIVLAARRRSPVLLRAALTAAATAMTAGWVMTQSKGAAAGLAVSAVCVFTLCPARLRLVVPALLVAALTAAGFGSLTVPVQETRQGPLLDAIDTAATAQLFLTVVGLAVGLVYALLDRRIEVSDRTRRLAGLAGAAVAFAGVAAGIVLFLVSVGSPVAYAEEKWDEFKTRPERETTETHLTSLGSNRYDFWRVALLEFADHPVAGVGARGWSASYLAEGKSSETPARSHSLVLDVLSETGLVGLLLLAGAVGIPLVALARRLDRVPAAAAFGAGISWLVHASVDWTWTFPAAAIPLFVLLGIPLASSRARPSTPAERYVAGGAAVAIALFAFAPPWIAARLTERALQTGGEAAESDLAWARRLDPLSVEPLLAEARLAATPQRALPALERAAGREPRSVGVRYLLGLTYLRAGRRAQAREELLAARELFPRDRLIRQALRAAQ